MERAVAAAFERYDVDHSGAIDRSELAELCASLGLPLTATEAATAVRYLDADGSGQIEKNEFVDWWLRRSTGAAVDLDGDGVIDETERKLSSVGQAGGTEALRLQIEQIRFDRDELHKEILAMQEEQHRVQRQITECNERMRVLHAKTQRDVRKREEADAVIQQSESVYMAILDSSQALLASMRTALPRLGVDSDDGAVDA